MTDLDVILDRLIATCRCDACQRYRRAFATTAGVYAARIEEQLRRRHR